MPTGELITRGTIWLALMAGAAGAGINLVASSNFKPERIARWAWTVGGIAYLGHIASAFHFYHHWSHGAAYQETARQTAAMVGLNWGGGIYFNYVFTLAWLAVVAWWWCDPQWHACRSRLLSRCWHSLFLFMVFNGAVVFGHGPVRWLGLVLCLGLGGLWWIHGRRKRDVKTPRPTRSGQNHL